MSPPPHAHLSAKWTETISPKGVSGIVADWFLMRGEVVGVHIDGSAVETGKIDIVNLQLLAQRGYMDFTCVQSIVSPETLTWP